MWYSNGTFRYVFNAEFVTLVSLKVPSGSFYNYDKCLFFFLSVGLHYIYFLFILVPALLCECRS